MTATISLTETLSGPQKACVMMITMGEARSSDLLSQFEENEIEIISHTMSKLGKISAKVVESVMQGFNEKLSEQVTVPEYPPIKKDTEKDNKSLWDRLDNVSEDLIANYLTIEHPQTAAVILLKMEPRHAAKVIEIIPEKLAGEIVTRMMKAEPIRDDVLNNIERTLRAEIMSTQFKEKDAKRMRRTATEILGHISDDRGQRLLSLASRSSPDVAAKVRKFLFTLEDLREEKEEDVAELLRNINKKTLATALKGSSIELIDFFSSQMTERTSNSIRNEMEKLGPVRLRDVDIAQEKILEKARSLVDSGLIKLNKLSKRNLVLTR